MARMSLGDARVKICYAAWVACYHVVESERHQNIKQYVEGHL